MTPSKLTNLNFKSNKTTFTLTPPNKSSVPNSKSLKKGYNLENSASKTQPRRNHSQLSNMCRPKLAPKHNSGIHPPPHRSSPWSRLGPDIWWQVYQRKLGKDVSGTVLLRSAMGLELYSTSFSEQLLRLFKPCEIFCTRPRWHTIPLLETGRGYRITNIG